MTRLLHILVFGSLSYAFKIEYSNKSDIIETTEHSMTWTKYHPLDHFETYLNYLENTYDFVELELIGQTYEKRPLKVLKVCKNGCGKPALWIDGGIHAREWISPATVTWLMKELIENASKHPELLEKLDWYFLPILNPDGYVYSHEYDRLWRKSRSCFLIFCLDWLLPKSFPCRGTDLNRNWDYQWNHTNQHTSSNFCYPTFRGYWPFYDLETRAVKDFILEHKNQIKFFNTIHSYSQMILYPWSYSKDVKPKNHEKLEYMAKKGNEALFKVHGTKYQVGPAGEVLYEASGTSMDWAFGEAGIPYAFTMELRPDSNYFRKSGFKLPEDEIIPTGEEIWAFHETVAKLIIDEFASEVIETNIL